MIQDQKTNNLSSNYSISLEREGVRMKKVLFVVVIGMMLVSMSASSLFAADWAIDPVHSNVGFKVTHMVISKVKGQFDDFSGTIKNFDGEKFSDASVEVTVQTASVNTQNDRRDGHLRSGDFFGADSFPTITFVSTKVTPAKDGKFQVTGNLTMRGVTKPVTLDVVYNGMVPMGDGKAKAGFSATTTINRQDWGVSWSKNLDAGGLVVSDDVDLIFELELNKES